MVFESLSIAVYKAVHFICCTRAEMSSNPEPCRCEVLEVKTHSSLYFILHSPLRRRLSRLAAAICAKPASRPRKLRLSRELAEKNTRLSRRENCGLNTKNQLLKFSASLS